MSYGVGKVVSSRDGTQVWSARANVNAGINKAISAVVQRRSTPIGLYRCINTARSLRTHECILRADLTGYGPHPIMKLHRESQQPNHNVC